MSENPYAPPTSDLGREPVAGTGDIDIGLCLSEGWECTWANFPLWLGVGIVAFAAALLATVTVLGIFLVIPVLAWGGFRFHLRMYDGEAEFGDLFQGFEVYGTALGAMLLLWLFGMLVSLVGQSVQMAGDLSGEAWLTAIGIPLNLFFSLMVVPRLTFAYFYSVDRGLGPVEALREAWRDTAPVKWKVVLLVLAMIVVMLAGLLCLGVGIIPATVVSYLMWTSAYRQLAGRPRAA